MASHLKKEEPRKGKLSIKKPDIRKTAETLKNSTSVKASATTQKGKRKKEHTNSLKLKLDAVLSVVLFLVLLFIKIANPTKVITIILDVAVILAAGYVLPMDILDSIQEKNYFNSPVLFTAAAIFMLLNKTFGAAAAICVCWRAICAVRGFTDYRNDLILANITASVPASARLVKEEGSRSVSIKAIHAGDIIDIAAGESAAFDGIVLSGESAADISGFAGKSASLPIHPGSRIYAGSVNLTNDIQVKVTQEYGESFANNFARSAESAVNGKSDTLRFAESLGKFISPLFTAAALIVALVYLIKHDTHTGLNYAAVLFLIAGMSDLIGAISDCFVSGVVNSAKVGVLFKQSFLISAMAKVKTIVTGETGIVTEGVFEVTEVHPVTGLSEKDLLSIAVAAETGSDHPIARAIKAAGNLINLTTSDVVKVEESTGRGITAFIGDHYVYVGNADHINDHGIIYTAGNFNGNVVHVAVDNKYCGCLILKDNVRNGTFEALDDLRLKGIRNLTMLTGCTRNVSRPMASSLNYDMVKPELSSEEKVSALKYLMSGKEPGSRLAFIGDYSTDRDLLDLADLGIAMKTLGDPEAIENTDVCVLGDDLSSVSAAYSYCLEADRAAKVGLYVNLGVKAVALLFVILNIIPVYIAAIFLTAALAFAYLYANVDYRIDGASVKISGFFKKVRSLFKKH